MRYNQILWGENASTLPNRRDLRLLHNQKLTSRETQRAHLVIPPTTDKWNCSTTIFLCSPSVVYVLMNSHTASTGYLKYKKERILICARLKIHFNSNEHRERWAKWCFLPSVKTCRRCVSLCSHWICKHLWLHGSSNVGKSRHNILKKNVDESYLKTKNHLQCTFLEIWPMYFELDFRTC